MEAGHQGPDAIALCRRSGSFGSWTGRKAGCPPDPEGRMVTGGMANRRIQAHQVLAFHYAGKHSDPGSGLPGQAEVAHRAGLRRAETGRRSGRFRREDLAWLPPSRQPQHCLVWLPCRRACSAFPPSAQNLRWIPETCRSRGSTLAKTPHQGPSVIIRGRSPRSGFSSTASSSCACIDARGVAEAAPSGNRALLCAHRRDHQNRAK